MTTRIATLADGQAKADLWNQALSAMRSFWPEPLVATSLSASQDSISDKRQTTFLAEDKIGLLGYFEVRLEALPDLGMRDGPYLKVQCNDGQRLVIWITKTGLKADQYKAVLDALFDEAWFPRDKGQLCWGTLPRSCPKDSLAYLDARFPHIEYDGLLGKWSVWWWTP